jgi:macrolide-specific efflux system membrane fusion protein
MKKAIAIAAGAALLVGAVAAGGWTVWGAQPADTEPATIAVSRGDVEQTVLASGSLLASAVTSVGAEVSGTIEVLAVTLGQRIEKGDLIAEINSVDQQNAVKSAEASFANLQAQLIARQMDLRMAEAALDRANRLKKQNLLSDADLLTAEAGLTAAQAGIASLEAQLSQADLAVESAKLNLERTRITAPVSGTIVAVLVTPGQSVNAAQASPTIVKIADLDTMLIKAQISEADVTKVAPNQKATFTILGDPTKRMDATLLAVEPAPDAITTSDTGLSTDNAIYYNGILSVSNPDHLLRIAMTAQVTITIDERRDVLTLPAAALGNAGRDGKYRAMVYDRPSGQIRPTEVTVGLNNNITAEIVDGLAEGDEIVAGPAAAAARGPGSGGPGGFGGGRMGGLGGPGGAMIVGR